MRGVPQQHILSLAKLAGRTGRGVRIAIIDSGIHASHPHVGGIAGAFAIDDRGRQYDDVTDRVGHGTAVAAAIHEKAPEAALLVVKVFDRSLAATAAALAAAIRLSADQGVHLVNLSLGTTNAEHAPLLRDAVTHAAERGLEIIAAAPTSDHEWLPGALEHVIAVELDWSCARDECRAVVDPRGSVRVRASGYPRPIAGVPPERNLKGQSFAVANATGLLALAREHPSWGTWLSITT